MRVIESRNVNGLFVQGLRTLAEHGEHASSRAGEVVVAPWPVTSVYSRPKERVLFCPVRNANPFFHFYEGLWMLAGRRDAASLGRYVSDFGTRFSEPDGNIHGAYGHRWRHAMGFDQLDAIVDKLRSYPTDRQCVLQMWDGHDEDVVRDVQTKHQVFECETAGQNDLLGTWKDRPCNTHVYFRVRNLKGVEPLLPVLDMTILCRSNDIVWGAYGANAVHFSMLMEYVAGRVGVEVGTMYQVSNNWHGYVETLDKLGDPMLLDEHDLYADGDVRAMPMAEDWEAWDTDLGVFMKWHDCVWKPQFDVTKVKTLVGIDNEWFRDVAANMTLSYVSYKEGNWLAAMGFADSVRATDWSTAASDWLMRRNKGGK